MTNLRSRAERSLANEVSKLVEGALANPEVPVDRERLDRIRALRDTISVLPRSAAPERLVAVAIIGISILSALAIWLWRVSTVDFSADLTARQAGIRNSANVLAEARIEGKSVHFENGARIWGLGFPADDDISAPHDVSGETVWLTNVKTDGPGMTEIRPSADGLDLIVSDGKVFGTLIKQDVGGLPDSAEFEAVASDGRPVVIHIASAVVDPIAVNGLAANTDFLLKEEYAPNGEEKELFRSTIIGGSVAVPVGKRKITLRAGDTVEMRDLRLRWLEITIDKGVHLVMEGTGRELIVGPRNAVEDLRPTMLQTALESDSVKLLWGAILFISGLLWNVRKFVGGASG